MGKPIVSTDVDGLRDILVDEENALVVPPRQPEALARAILRVLDEPPLFERLSRESRACSERFDIQIFVDKMSRLYEQLVERYQQVSFRRPRWNYESDFSYLEAQPGSSGKIGGHSGDPA